MEPKKTLVLGASENPERYSNLAIRQLKSHGHPVIAIGLKPGMAHVITIHHELLSASDINTVTLYLNPKNQVKYYDYILSVHPQRIIFNPGTENEEPSLLAEKKGIKTLEACTLVLLSTNQY